MGFVLSSIMDNENDKRFQGRRKSGGGLKKRAWEEHPIFDSQALF
jgi:hypothetical protein